MSTEFVKKTSLAINHVLHEACQSYRENRQNYNEFLTCLTLLSKEAYHTKCLVDLTIRDFSQPLVVIQGVYLLSQLA